MVMLPIKLKKGITKRSNMLATWLKLYRLVNFFIKVFTENYLILMGKRELIALLNLSSWCLVMVERLSLALPRGCLQFVIVVFPDHSHLLFLICF